MFEFIRSIADSLPIDFGSAVVICILCIWLFGILREQITLQVVIFLLVMFVIFAVIKVVPSLYLRTLEDNRLNQLILYAKSKQDDRKICLKQRPNKRTSRGWMSTETAEEMPSPYCKNLYEELRGIEHQIVKLLEKKEARGTLQQEERKLLGDGKNRYEDEF